MRIFLMLSIATFLAGCETFEGFKKDVVKGVDAVEDAVSN